jgi:hypothetical protein
VVWSRCRAVGFEGVVQQPQELSMTSDKAESEDSSLEYRECLLADVESVAYLDGITIRIFIYTLCTRPSAQRGILKRVELRMTMIVCLGGFFESREGCSITQHPEFRMRLVNYQPITSQSRPSMHSGEFGRAMQPCDPRVRRPLPPCKPR